MDPTLAWMLFGTALFAGPAALWAWGRRRLGPPAPARWDGRLFAASLLAYVLAFNLTFFLQELFLVLPKALVPGLKPVLYHNDHDWTGHARIAELLQGTGALAILVSGCGFALLARASIGRTAAVRLLVLWMAYQGLIQALSQIAVGAAVPGNDIARAMNYLGLGPAAKTALGAVSLALIALIALWLGRRVVAMGARGTDPRRFISRYASLPAIAAVPLILPYRVPREWIEVLFVPLLTTWIGIAWLQAGAWRAAASAGKAPPRPASPLPLLLAALVLLALFQLVLRPGIRFS